MGVAILDPFDTFLLEDCNIFAPPATPDASGQRIFDPKNPGTAVATVKARRSMMGRGREFKSDKKTVIVNEKIFMRPYAALSDAHYLQIGPTFFHIVSIDDPSHMGHHYEVWVERLLGVYPTTFYAFLLEDGSGVLTLEDGSGRILLEA